MRIASIARERRMPESSVRTIVKRQDQIKELASRTSHLSPSTVVRKKIYSCNSRGSQGCIGISFQLLDTYKLFQFF